MRAFIIAAIMGVSAPAAAADPQDLVFDVYRNGEPFGEHVLDFEREADALRVDIRVRLRAGLGPITLFRYEHDSEEVWRGDNLLVLTSRTLKDGDEMSVSLDARGMLDPSSHWRGYAPGRYQVLNTETGEPMDVEVVDLGVEWIETATGRVEARRTRLTGTVMLDLWHDASGRWVKCAFEVRGQNIEYVLRS